MRRLSADGVTADWLRAALSMVVREVASPCFPGNWFARATRRSAEQRIEVVAAHIDSCEKQKAASVGGFC
jgi:hypothetical protein